MPKYQHRIDQHRLFLIEWRGDTIIVTPKGDPAGFANLNFNLEHTALVKLLKKDKYKNVLVDLGSSNYFGAKILGAMSEWANLVEAKGGKFALCEVSHDMRELLRIFDFHDQWKLYPTREEGIKAVVTQTPLETIRQHWLQLSFVACTALAVGLSFLPWDQYYAQYVNQKDYQAVLEVWEEMQQLKAANAPPPEWRKLQNRAQRELEPLVPRLERRAGMSSQHAQVAKCLLHVTRDYLFQRLLVQRSRLDLDRPTSPEQEIFWFHTSIYMEKARRIMAGEDASDLDFPQLTEAFVASHQHVFPQAPSDSRANEIEENSPAKGPDETPRPFRPAVAEPSPGRTTSSREETW